MISKATIDQIFDTARIEEVIEDFVALKKSGSNYKGLSPFTNEKSPSFMVSPAKQIFKDFSSGKGGSVVTFLMEHEQYSYPEALRYLAQKYNIEVEEDQPSDEARAERDQRESLFLVNEYANKFFQKQLWEAEEGRQVGLSYFRERGFSDATIENFQLGYSPDGYTAFTDAALKDNYQLDYLAETGLTKVDGQRKLDRFRGRVMFPILSHTGRTLGFGGRILKTDAKAAKYLNSPESPIYHKSKILYGVYQAKRAIAKADECYLVEGYTDVISLHQSGVENVVASSGTSLTKEQIALIKRFTPNITLLFDGDAAGLRASLRGIDMILAEGMQVQVVLFPEGEDPDSYAKSHSAAELKTYLQEEATNFLRFKARLLLKDAGGSPLEKSKAAREMVKSIALIPDELERQAYVKETAQIMELEEQILYRELGQERSQQRRREEREERRQAQREERSQNMQVVPEASGRQSEEGAAVTPAYNQEKALCWLLLNYGGEEYVFPSLRDEDAETKEDPPPETVASFVLNELAQDELDFAHPHLAGILARFHEHYNQGQPPPKPEDFMRGGDKELMQLVVDLISDDRELHDWRRKKIYPADRAKAIPTFTEEALLRFKERNIAALIKKLQRDIPQNNEQPADPEKLQTLQRLIQLKVAINRDLRRIF